MTNELEPRSSGESPAGGPPDTPDSPPAGQTGEEAGTIAERTGRNPANLGDEVTEAGDVTHPTPDPDGPQL
jgi:hypothetical protein